MNSRVSGQGHALLIALWISTFSGSLVVFTISVFLFAGYSLQIQAMGNKRDNLQERDHRTNKYIELRRDKYFQ